MKNKLFENNNTLIEIVTRGDEISVQLFNKEKDIETNIIEGDSRKIKIYNLEGENLEEIDLDYKDYLNLIFPESLENKTFEEAYQAGSLCSKYTEDFMRVIKQAVLYSSIEEQEEYVIIGPNKFTYKVNLLTFDMDYSNKILNMNFKDFIKETLISAAV